MGEWGVGGRRGHWRGDRVRGEGVVGGERWKDGGGEEGSGGKGRVIGGRGMGRRRWGNGKGDGIEEGGDYERRR